MHNSLTFIKTLCNQASEINPGEGFGNHKNEAEAVMAAIAVCKSHRECLENCDPGTYIPPAMHVVCLTDGCANQGITSASSMRTDTLETVGDDNIFVHYIGLGSGVQPEYMTKATNNGSIGVFTSSPDASKLSNAFEEVFGFAMQTRNSFTVKITDGQGERIEKHGMLLKERGVIVNVALKRHDEETTMHGFKVQLLDRGQLIGQEVSVDVRYSGVEPGAVVQKVADVIMREDAISNALKILREAGSVRNASLRLREYTDTLVASGASAPVVARIEAMAVDAEAAVSTYEQMSQQDEGHASQMYASRSATVSQYY